jgi:hypothetical protein
MSVTLAFFAGAGADTFLGRDESRDERTSLLRWPRDRLPRSYALLERCAIRRQKPEALASFLQAGIGHAPARLEAGRARESGELRGQIDARNGPRGAFLKLESGRGRGCGKFRSACS